VDLDHPYRSLFASAHNPLPLRKEGELEYRRMSQSELTDRLGLAGKTVNQIIKAKASITPEDALKPEKVVRQSAEYWLNLEVRYREALARREELRANWC